MPTSGLIRKCGVDVKSSICDTSLNSTEIEAFKKYYNKESINKKRYLAVFGTTLVVTKQESRIFIQSYFLNSILIIQRYTNIRFVVFTDSQQIIDECTSRNIKYSTEYKTNEFNVPILKSIINTLETNYESWFYGYLNGDILLSLNIEDILIKVLNSIYKKELKQEVILVSTRSNVQDTFFYNKTITNNYNYVDLLNEAYENSEYYIIRAIDVFIATKYTLTNHLVDDAVIGRYFIDNYIMDNANFRSEFVEVIDVTPSILTIHISGNEQYKSDQIQSDLLYNSKYFATESEGYFCDILLSSYLMKETNHSYIFVPIHESYLWHKKYELKLLSCYQKYLIENKCSISRTYNDL
ncbi:hypothetical protein WA158_004441 [Blastocystis sp. Blastoise]